MQAFWQEYGKWILIALVALGIYLLVAPFLGRHPLEGKPAPAVQVPLYGGGTLDLREHLGKDVIVLDFWASWCPPCRKGLPALARFAQDYHGRGTAVYAVNLGEDQGTIQMFLDEQKLDLPVAMDKDQSAAVQYQVSSIPQTVVIDRQGVVQKVYVGYSPRLETNLRRKVNALLQAGRQDGQGVPGV